MRIRPRPHESIHQLLKRFRRMLEKDGLTKDIRRKAFYEKPSEIRSRAKRRAQREREKQKPQDNKR